LKYFPIIAAALAGMLAGFGCSFDNRSGGHAPQVRTSEDGRFQVSLPEGLSPYIQTLRFDPLGENQPVVEIRKIRGGLFHIHVVFELNKDLTRENWRLEITPGFVPDFHWSPHLTPSEGTVVDQHAFRSPALIAADRWYMDLDAPGNALSLGMSETEVVQGLFFERRPGALYPAGRRAAQPQCRGCALSCSGYELDGAADAALARGAGAGLPAA